MRKVPGFVAGLLTAALAGCVVTPVEYRYAPPPPAAPPAPEPVAYESDVTASEPPPPLPVYEQPPCPVEGYVWTPGLWRWGPSGFYWVPGTWVAPPAVGLLWTPGYWVLAGPVFVFHAGYWGPHVGYYGGINYGGGYTGEGYHGGRWVNNTFQYNTAVSNVNVTNIHNTYNQTIINNVTINNTTIVRTSYAGGPGTRTERTAREVEVANERHLPATTLQVRHDDSARADPQLAAAHNAGHPPIAATPRPGAFTAPGVTAARPVGPAWHPKAAPEVAERPARSDGAMARTPETAAHPAPPFAHAPEPGVAPRRVQPVTPPVTARVQEAQPRPRPQAQQPPQQPRAQPKPQAQPQSAPRPQSRPDRREGEKKPPEQKGEHGTERAQ
ncbi:MAG TPA: hypothetical protein VFK87_11040 [Steroidobacteraceae bacterium]|nr:hypothetical protein [Steroidobacteraceae bacterium]